MCWTMSQSPDRIMAWDPRSWLHNWMASRMASGERVRLGYRRIFILPTREGLLFATIGLAIWIGAVNYNNNLAFVLAFLLAGFGITAMVHSFRNLLGLEITAGEPEPVFAGDTVRFPITLHNPLAMTRYGVVVSADGAGETASHLGPEHPTTVAVAVPTRHRGLLPLPLLTVATRFPGGLFRAWARVRLPVTARVRPTPEAPPVPAPLGGGTGGTGEGTRAGDDDFSGLRPYQPGDPLHRVAWHSLARDRELQTKQFTGEAVSRSWLDYDATQGLEYEARLARLCRWLLDAEQQGQMYGLRLPTRRVQPARGPAHLHHCLDLLTQLP